jgi:hypothetical protein
MKYKEIKDKRQSDTNELLESLGVFWAFSNEQFKAGLDTLIKTEKLKSGEKLTNIGAGGFIPSKNFQAMLSGMEKIENNFKAGIKEAKARVENILYELNNHEAFYTGDIEPTLEALGDDYTSEEVTAVYKDYKAKKYARPTVKDDYIVQIEDGTIHKITEAQAEDIASNKESQYD